MVDAGFKEQPLQGESICVTDWLVAKCVKWHTKRIRAPKSLQAKDEGRINIGILNKISSKARLCVISKVEA